MRYRQLLAGTLLAAVFAVPACKPKNASTAVSGDAAMKAYVPPGKYDEYYNFLSGGFSGQMSVYGLPSGRLFRVIPVFSVDPEKGWGYSEETKPMLNTSHGFVPWDDLHHTELSQTNGEIDGRWIFGNANNTPRVARIDLKTFRTVEIIELPNSAGNHSSPFITENTEYVVAGTRFSVPVGDKTDVAIDSYKKNFKGTISFIRVGKEGEMDIAFQLLLPGVNFDLSHAGKGPSHGWFFFSCYNTEQANTLLEVNASQRDKDFILAVNWKKAEEYLKAGKGVKQQVRYAHNTWDETTHTGKTEIRKEVTVLDPAILKEICYFIPCPKSPHGCDVDPTGEYIVGSGKLAALIPVFSYTKLQKAIADKAYEGEFEGIPVVKYEAALHGEVKKPGLGPLHTEFDGKGNAYTSFFVCVFDRIAQKVYQNLLQAPFVADKVLCVFIHLERNVQGFFLCQFLYHSEACGAKFFHRNGLDVEFKFAGFDLGKVEDVVDQIKQVASAFYNDADILYLLVVERARNLFFKAF